MPQPTTPLWGQILFAIIAPAVVAGIIWLANTGLASGANGGILTARARRHRSLWVKGFLWVMYPVSFAIVLWSRIWPPGTLQPAPARAIETWYRANHPLISGFISYAIAVPVFALLGWAFGRWLLAAVGVGGRTQFSKRRFLKEFLVVLAAVYAYVGCAAALGIH